MVLNCKYLVNISVSSADTHCRAHSEPVDKLPALKQEYLQQIAPGKKLNPLSDQIWPHILQSIQLTETAQVGNVPATTDLRLGESFPALSDSSFLPL